MRPTRKGGSRAVDGEVSKIWRRRRSTETRLIAETKTGGADMVWSSARKRVRRTAVASELAAEVASDIANAVGVRLVVTEIGARNSGVVSGSGVMTDLKTITAGTGVGTGGTGTGIMITIGSGK